MSPEILNPRGAPWHPKAIPRSLLNPYTAAMCRCDGMGLVPGKDAINYNLHMQCACEELPREHNWEHEALQLLLFTQTWAIDAGRRPGSFTLSLFLLLPDKKDFVTSVPKAFSKEHVTVSES